MRWSLGVGLILVGSWIISSTTGCALVIDADWDGKVLKVGDEDMTGGSSSGGGSGGSEAGGTGNGGSGDGGSGGDGSGGNGSGGDGSGGDGGSDTGGAGGTGGDATGGTGGYDTGGTGGDSSGGTGGVGGSGGDNSGGAGGTGGSGGGGSSSSCENVVINEVENHTGSEFVELYNQADEAADISFCYLTDEDAGLAGAYQFPNGTTISAHGFIVLYDSQDPSCDPDCLVLNFTIRSTGETISFFDDEQTLIDSVDYPNKDDAGAPTFGQTLGRLPNGTGSFTSGVPTPGASNSGS